MSLPWVQPMHNAAEYSLTTQIFTGDHWLLKSSLDGTGGWLLMVLIADC
jgi:hypothetical protein